MFLLQRLNNLQPGWQANAETVVVKPRIGRDAKEVTRATECADRPKMSLAQQAQIGPASPPVRPWIPLLAYAMVVVVFIGDWILPDSVVVDVAYQAPVFFAALKGSARLTSLTVVLGSLGIALGWYVDLANASFVFNDVRTENRLLSLVSLLLVGTLADLLQRHAQRTARLEDERAVLREVNISSAIDRVMGGLSPDQTIRAFAGAAPELLEATAVVWCPRRGEGEFWVTHAGTSEAKSLPVERPSEDFSALMQRVSAQRSVEIVNSVDSIDWLLNGGTRPPDAPGMRTASPAEGSLGSPRAGRLRGSRAPGVNGGTQASGQGDVLAIPVGGDADVEGVVFAAVRGRDIGSRNLAMAQNFGRFATAALHQARLLDQLERSAGRPGDGPSPAPAPPPR
jgi:hypothetical protein